MDQGSDLWHGQAALCQLPLRMTLENGAKT